MSRRGCPICRKTHPATAADADDLSAEPTCGHWIGRLDPDYGFEGNLRFLDELELAPLDADADPAREAVEAAFGEWAQVAARAYDDGFTHPGYARDLLLALLRRCGIRYITVAGESLMGWSYTDYFVSDPKRALDEIRAAASAIHDGMGRLKHSTASEPHSPA
jgi:hypothetical protein